MRLVAVVVTLRMDVISVPCENSEGNEGLEFITSCGLSELLPRAHSQSSITFRTLPLRMSFLLNACLSECQGQPSAASSLDIVSLPYLHWSFKVGNSAWLQTIQTMFILCTVPQSDK